MVGSNLRFLVFASYRSASQTASSSVSRKRVTKNTSPKQRKTLKESLRFFFSVPLIVFLVLLLHSSTPSPALFKKQSCYIGRSLLPRQVRLVLVPRLAQTFGAVKLLEGFTIPRVYSQYHRWVLFNCLSLMFLVSFGRTYV